MTSRQKWVQDTRDSVLRAMRHMGCVPLSASALEGNLDIDTWTSIGPCVRTRAEISAALIHHAKEGNVRRLGEDERTEVDPRGTLYELTADGYDLSLDPDAHTTREAYG